MKLILIKLSLSSIITFILSSTIFSIVNLISFSISVSKNFFVSNTSKKLISLFAFPSKGIPLYSLLMKDVIILLFSNPADKFKYPF